jgi:hypothetical protein
MRHQGHGFGVLFENLLYGWNGSHDSSVILNFALLQWNIEIDSNENSGIVEMLQNLIDANLFAEH